MSYKENQIQQWGQRVIVWEKTEEEYGGGAPLDWVAATSVRR